MLVKELMKKIKVKNYNEKIFNKKIKLISVDKDLVKSIHTKNHVSQAAYVKFYIPLLFKDKDEILFIDGDTLVLEDISELKNVVKDIEEPIAAVWNPFTIMIIIYLIRIKLIRLLIAVSYI